MIESFTDYLLVDHRGCKIEHLIKGENGMWKKKVYQDQGDIFHIESMRVTIKLNELYDFESPFKNRNLHSH